ncbi:MAG: hypothetical protein GY929_02470 [Actinomycetia bacterium]|nr:hypothetical protein [Actinomycetes bacterium]
MSARRSSAYLFVAAVVAYWLTQPGDRSEAEDVFSFAWGAENGPVTQRIISRQPLFIALHRALYLLADGIGLDVRAYTIMRVVSCVASAGALVLFHRLLVDRYAVAPNHALIATAGLGVSYGFWRYAAEAEVYALAYVALLAALLVGTGGPLVGRRLAVTAGLGLLAFGVNYFNLIPLGLVIGAHTVCRPGLDTRARRTQLPRTLVTGGVIGAAAIMVSLVVWAIVDPADTGWSEWYQEETGGSFVPPMGELAKAPVGIGQNVLAGNFLFDLGPSRDILVDVFADKQLAEELFAAEKVSGVVSGLALGTAVATAVAAVALLIAARVGLLDRLRQSDLWPVLAWLIALFMIIAPSSAANPEAWAMILLPAWILAARVVLPGVRRPELAIGFVVILAAHNLVGGWLYHRDSAHDYNAVGAAWFDENAGAHDLVLDPSPTFTRWVRYWTEADAADTSVLAPPEVQAATTNALAAGHRVFVTDRFFDPPPSLRAGPDINELLAVTHSFCAGAAPVDHTEVGTLWQLASTDADPAVRPLGCDQ